MRRAAGGCWAALAVALVTGCGPGAGGGGDDDDDDLAPPSCGGAADCATGTVVEPRALLDAAGGAGAAIDAALLRAAGVAGADVLDAATGQVLATTNADGAFAFVPPGGELGRLAARKSGFVATTLPEPPPAGERAGITLFLIAAGTFDALAGARGRSGDELLQVGGAVLIFAEADASGRAARFARAGTTISLLDNAGRSVELYQGDAGGGFRFSGLDLDEVGDRGLVGLGNFVAIGVATAGGAPDPSVIYPARFLTTVPGFAAGGFFTSNAP